MTDFSALLASITTDAETCSVTATDDWLQGRTLYGGLAAAFCLEGAARQFADLPPLRSAQFAFVGPAVGTVTVRASLLRRGKSTVFLGVELSGEAGLATRATLCYGVARDSVVAFDGIATPTVAAPANCPVFFRDIPGLNFVQHFDTHLAAGHFPLSGNDPDMTLWLRHRDPNAPASATALMALADAAPPAAMVRFPKFAPISTMTWAIDLLTDRLETAEGWWLVRTAAETIASGYSSQAITVWNAARQPVMACRQNVAVFI
jgi:hypothetical protein